MNKIIIISAILLASCNTLTGIQYISPTPIDEDMFYYTLDIVELYYEHVYEVEFDIYDALENYPVIVEWTEWNNEDVHGETFTGNPTRIFLKPQDNCKDKWGVFAHEMLHWLIFGENLGTFKQSIDHSLPNVFWEPGFGDGTEAISWWVSLDLRYTCEGNQESLFLLRERM